MTNKYISRKEATFELLPSVSIVTVVFNARSIIEETIRSVIAQTYTNIEYIVVDGGSTDGTLEILHKYRSKISMFSSEPDLGIYDAMNKGIASATGHWINFMNAGDQFYADDSVAKAIAKSELDATVMYGAVEVRYPQFSRLQLPGPVSRLWSGMQFSHQSAFIALDYHQRNLYDLRYPVTSDLHFMYQAFKSGRKFVFLDQVIASVVTGGVSEARRIHTIWAAGKAVSAGKYRPFLRAFYIGQMLNAMARTFAKNILPPSFVQKLIRWK